MKIGLVSEHASPLAVPRGEDIGGQNVHVAGLAAALARVGHEVTVYTRRDDPALPAAAPLTAGAMVEHVPAGPPTPTGGDRLLEHVPAFGAWLARRWRHDPPDLVHAHYWTSGLAAMDAAGGDIPVVQTFHVLGSLQRRYQGTVGMRPPGRIKAEASIVRRAAAIIPPSTDQVRELGFYHARPSRVFVVPCGVDAAMFRARPNGAGRKPADPAPPGGGKRLVSLGRLAPHKGIDTVIAALADVPDAHLVIAGGPDAAALDHDAEIGRLRSAAAAARVADRVTFTGRVPHQEVPALLRSADAVISVPWYEPFGIVPLETMASGGVIIGSAVGGHLDTIEDGLTGLLVPPRDPATLAERIRIVLARPLLRASIGRAGLTQVRTRYTWDTIADQTEAVYRHVLEAGRQASEVGAVQL